MKEDEEEISTIYNCLLQLLQAGEPNVINQLPKLLVIFASDLSRLDETQRQTLAGVLQLLQQQYPQQMTVSIATLAPEQMAILQDLIQS